MPKVSAKRTNKSVTVADIPRVGPGTPSGEWFRRYWVVVGIARDLYDIPQAVKVLGEAGQNLHANRMAGDLFGTRRRGGHNTTKVRDPEKLKLVRVGDLVELTYAEAIAVSVEPAPR